MTKNVQKKKLPRQKKGTLDQQHVDKLKSFEKKTNSLPNKKRKILTLKKELAHLKKINPNKYTNKDIKRKAYLLDSIERLKTQVTRIENCTDSLNYIVDVLPILVNYYDINNKIIDDEMEENIISNNIGTKKNILTYFAKEATAQKNEIETKTPKSTRNGKKCLTTPSGSKTTKVNVQPVKQSKATLYENYLCATDSSYRKPVRIENNKCTDVKCPGEKILCQTDGCITCNVCGMFESTLMVMEKPNYKEPTQDSGIYAYKRINHLTEILSQLQAKESTDIPQKIFESILRELKKRKIDKNNLDIFRLRRILKKLNFIKYYEHVPHILQIINGKAPPNFSRIDEAKIKKMFKNIQKPFALHCPKNRKNFLNYSYVLHKFCELLDLDDYIAYFPLLKNNSKLLQHDKIWKNICECMNWAFYKSI